MKIELVTANVSAQSESESGLVLKMSLKNGTYRTAICSSREMAMAPSTKGLVRRPSVKSETVDERMLRTFQSWNMARVAKANERAYSIPFGNDQTNTASVPLHISAAVMSVRIKVFRVMTGAFLLRGGSDKTSPPRVRSVASA